ncbi:Lysosomal alpha-glucosidase [Solea senegalensis]|uniref:Lysosomal alpha-glucosidase n=1 Tax=Solea senegalensis TaxID=28829 RepID=A0AAV6PLZ1_SOLSE|nr:Lysosomal alpha-glucosidase [Solea senegalensis]
MADNLMQSPENWTESQVSTWLRTLRVKEQYIKKLFEEEVNGPVLLTLDEDFLITKIGMKFGPTHMIIKKINEFLNSKNNSKSLHCLASSEVPSGQDVSKLLMDVLKCNVDQTPVTSINIYHHPGSGGSTVARQVLWQNRKELRCAVVKPSYSVTDVTQHAVVLREYEEKADNLMQSPENWTESQVSTWLRTLRVKEQYIKKLFEEEVNGPVLLTLDEDFLITKIGMKFGPTHMIIKKINEFLNSKNNSKSLHCLASSEVPSGQTCKATQTSSASVNQRQTSRELCETETVNNFSVVGMKMSHINATMQMIQPVKACAKKHLPVFVKGTCLLETNQEEHMASLEILTVNHCDDISKDFINEANIEQQFYRGGRVTWMNFWLAEHKYVGEDPGISSTSPTGTYPPFDDGLKRDVFIKNVTGHILIGKDPALTTTASRRNPFFLTVALSAGGWAWGDLFWDDGDSLDTYKTQEYCYVIFTAGQSQVVSDPLMLNGALDELVLGGLQVFGVPSPPHYVLANGEKVSDFMYHSDTKVLTVTMPMAKVFTVQWAL